MFCINWQAICKILPAHFTNCCLLKSSYSDLSDYRSFPLLCHRKSFLAVDCSNPAPASRVRMNFQSPENPKRELSSQKGSTCCGLGLEAGFCPFFACRGPGDLQLGAPAVSIWLSTWPERSRRPRPGSQWAARLLGRRAARAGRARLEARKPLT